MEIMGKSHFMNYRNIINRYFQLPPSFIGYLNAFRAIRMPRQYACASPRPGIMEGK